jgi:sugar lactone lactonase YvrE
MITTVAGTSTPGLSDHCDCADVGRGSVAVDGAENLYFFDSFRTREIASDGTVIPIVEEDYSSEFSGDNGPAVAAQLNGPAAVATDANGNVFIADRYNGRIRKVSPDGVITTVAGNGHFAFSGDGGPAIAAAFQDIAAIAVDGMGNLFVADRKKNRVRRVSSEGVITTVAGGGDDSAGDTGLATSAILSDIAGLAADQQGNLFISLGSSVKIVTPDGIISTFAGGGNDVYVDAGPAIMAAFLASAIAVDSNGSLYVADRTTQTIRQVRDGVIRTVARTGKGLGADGELSSSAGLSYVQALAVDSAGNLFLGGDSRVRKILTNGAITTIAGTGECCSYSGDNGPALNAEIPSVDGLAVDAAGNVFVADVWSNAVRVLQPVSQASVLQLR